MRYVTLLVDPGPEGFHPGHRTLTSESAVTREFVHHLHLLDDATVVLLYQIRGDLETARKTLEDSPTLFEYDIAEAEGEASLAYVYVHCEADEPVKSLLTLLQNSDVVLDLPLSFTADGLLRATLVGDQLPLHRVVTAASALDRVDLRLERTGEYTPDMRNFGSMLTDRQRQLLRLAVERGYYEVPRRATLADLAEEVDLSKATVGEHLQKVESTILSRVLP